MIIAPTDHEVPNEGSDPTELLIKEARRKARRRRIIFGLAVIVVAVVAGLLLLQFGGSNSARQLKPSPSDAASIAAPCTAAQLKFVDVGSPGGMAGSWNNLFLLKNVSATSCSVSGYPRLSLITAQGPFRYLHVATFKSNQFFGPIGIAKTKALPTVTMKSGSSVASFWVHGADEPTGSQTCHIATMVRLTLPGGRGSLQVQVSEDTNPFSWCGDGIAVLPLVPGVSGSMPARPLSSSFGHPLPARIRANLEAVGE